MRTIPPKLKVELSADPKMYVCARRKDGGCKGRVEWEHAIIWRGKQLNEVWAIVPICVYHHRGKGLNKQINKYFAYLQSADRDLEKYSRANFVQEKKYLLKKYDSRGNSAKTAKS